MLKIVTMKSSNTLHPRQKPSQDSSKRTGHSCRTKKHAIPHRQLIAGIP